MKNEKMTRGEFLRGSLGRLAGAATGYVDQKIQAVSPVEARPPWSLDEAEFLSTCQRCGACGDSCPRDIIDYHPESKGPFGLTPYLDFSEDYCDHCGKCADGCPSGALSKKDGSGVIGVATINKNTCPAYNGAMCRNCYDACGKQAMRLEKHMFPVVISEKCDGCGACVTDCMDRVSMTVNLKTNSR